MDRDLQSLRDTFATLQSLLEAPAGAEQIDLNDTMDDLLSAEGREAHMCGRKRLKNVGNFTGKLPGLNGNMEDMLVGQRREVFSRRRANAVKITGWQPDLNVNVGDDPHSDIKPCH